MKKKHQNKHGKGNKTYNYRSRYNSVVLAQTNDDAP